MAAISTYFWFIAGSMAGACATLIALPLLRSVTPRFGSRRARIALAAAGGIAFCGTALLLYQKLGSPQLLSKTVARPAHPDVAATPAGEGADSMEAAVKKLEDRIAREGGKPEEWLLLAQSYDFLGRTQDAERARTQSQRNGAGPRSDVVDSRATTPPGPKGGTAAPDSGSTGAPASANNEIAEHERRVKAQPNDADEWRTLASLYRRQHDFTKARAAFANLERLKSMTADDWADLADVLGSSSAGSLRGTAAAAIESALRLDPRHPKALWLKASLAHEERRYADALALWRQLRAALPDGSPDAGIVDANIAEAMELAGVRANATATARSSEVEVTGTVTVDRKLAARIPQGATLFIYAKAADSPGPPLAVLRQPASAWPVAFKLDDSLAMIPSRRLSQFDRVIVEARISRTGQAAASTGDLFARSAVLKPAGSKKLSLVIDHEVG